jgi:PAS domain S-box-containing protein
MEKTVVGYPKVTTESHHTPVDSPVGYLPGASLEGELARFFGFSHDVLAILDRYGRVLVMSPSVERVLGYAVDALVGERLLRTVHPEDRPTVKKKVRAMLRGRPIGDLNVCISREDGEWVPMRWSLSLGSDKRIYAVGRDHSDEVRHKDALLRHETAELRLRTALELHDGILQTLTGASLQIAVARRVVRTDPAAAEEVLGTLGNIIAAEQQEMRLYVDELKGSAPVWTDGSLGLPERIKAVLDRVGTIWNLTINVEIFVSARIGGEFGRQIVRIIQEGTVNAARHADATSVSVSVVLEGPDVTISIADNGNGFSFLGEYDHDALKENRLGPISLKHRVGETGGRISINSTPTGSTVFVRLPVPPLEAPE